MFWVLAVGSVWSASISVLAWLCHRAPIFDENERPVASAANTAPSQSDVRIGPRAVALTRVEGALVRRLNRGRPPSPHRAFRLTRQVVAAPALAPLTSRHRSFRLTR
jgi:hypothetical protein